jgi:hypothetical protein
MHDLQCTASRCDSQATYRTSYLQQSREERRRDAIGGELHVCGIGRKEVRDGCIVSRAWGDESHRLAEVAVRPVFLFLSQARCFADNTSDT